MSVWLSRNGIQLAILVWILLTSITGVPPICARGIRINSKIEGPLLEIWNAWRNGEPSVEHLASMRKVQIWGDRVRVVLEMDVPQVGDMQAIKTLGGTVEATSTLGLCKVIIPLSALDKISSLPTIRFIRRPFTPIPLNISSPMVSQGVPLFGGILFHTRNLLGQGIRVAVIDVGFGSLSRVLEAGELPPNITVWDFTGEGLGKGIAHGTAVAELVHDVAPEAELFLLKIGDEVDLDNAVTYCIEQGVDVIVHSIGWVNTNFCDGKGIICDISRRAVHAGIIWVNAAGNYARKHWVGSSIDEDRDGWYEFAPGDETLELEVNQPGWIEVYLTWNEWPKAISDLDLFLVGPTGEIIARSESPQDGNQPPVEDIHYFAQPPGRYAIKVQGPSDHLVELKLFSLNHPVKPAVAAQSLLAPADAPEVIAVGAIHYRHWFTGPQEAFSSQGPTADGRIKPDLMGPDGVSTFLYPEFIGTSAAAPHIGGAVALLLQKFGRENVSAGVTEIIGYLLSSAADMGPRGTDPIFGFGRLQLDFGLPRAKRDIDTPIVGNNVPIGETFVVRLRVEMPYGRLGSVTLEEKIPEGFSALPLESAGAKVLSKRGLIQWTWPSLEPGDVRIVKYCVTVGNTVIPGLYRWEGEVNGRPIEGEEEVRVCDPLSVLEAVAYWDSTVAKVDPNDPPYIDDEELMQARSWWLEDHFIPATGGQRLTWEDILIILALWAQGLSVNQGIKCAGWLPEGTTPVSSDIYSQQLEMEPDGSMITITINPLTTFFGFGLKLVLPPGWKLVPISADGGWFKGCEDYGIWVWPSIQQGQQKIVKFTVRAPWDLNAGTGQGADLHLIWRGICPSFKQEMDKEMLWNMVVDKADSTRISCAPNPVTSGRHVKFMALGGDVDSIRVKIFTLSGQLVLDTGWLEGETFQWGLYDMRGEVVPNGIYLYIVFVRGDELNVGSIGKLLVLR